MSQYNLSNATTFLISQQNLINISENSHLTIGVDEVGRGPLLGDVVVSAVILPNNIFQTNQQDLITAENVTINPEHLLYQLTDSKKLSEKKREQLFPIIQQTAIAWVVVKVPAKIIDEINILQATLLGMKQAIMHIINYINYMARHHKTTFSIMIDGNKLPTLDDLNVFSQIRHQQGIIQGDSKHACISAASVLAKVIRDRDMLDLAKKYPNYAIEKHKGYPTKLHLQAIADYGILPEHRRSFSPIKKLV